MSEEKVSLTMSTTSTDGKSATKSITDINDNASDSELMTFASAFNNLTTNSLGTVAKVTKRELDNETATNPIQSVTASTGSSGAYTVTGSGTAYSVAVNFDTLKTALENDSDGGGLNVSVNVVLPNGFTEETYSNKVHVDLGNLADEQENYIVPGIIAAPYLNGNVLTMCVFASLPYYSDEVIPLVVSTMNPTIRFDSVTVGGVKYAPWSITFTMV